MAGLSFGLDYIISKILMGNYSVRRVSCSVYGILKYCL